MIRTGTNDSVPYRRGFHRSDSKGVQQRLPELNIVRIQDVGLRGSGDPEILAFAAHDNRIVLSHDLSTMKTHARKRILEGEPMAGLFLLRQNIIVARAIDAIVFVAECSRDDEWNGKIEHLPL